MGIVGLLLVVFVAIPVLGNDDDVGFVCEDVETCDASDEVIGRPHLAEVLRLELEATNAILDASTRRLRALEELRERLLRGEELNLVEKADLEGLVEHLASRDACEDTRSLKKEDEDLLQFFDSFFLSRFVAALDGPSSRFDVMNVKVKGSLSKTMRKAGYRQIISVAFSLANSGSVRAVNMRDGHVLFDSIVDEIDGKTPLAIFASGAHKPSLAFIFADGLVKVFNITLFFEGKRVAGDKGSLDDGNPGLSLFVDFEREFRICNKEGDGAPVRERIESVFPFELKRVPVIISVTDAGILQGHTLSTGALRGAQMLEGDESVLSIAAAGPRLALNFGHEVAMVNSASLERNSNKVCATPKGVQVVDVVFDVLVPTFIYGGTLDGEVLVFNTRSRSGEGSKRWSSVACQVSRKLAVKQYARFYAREHGIEISNKDTRVYVTATTGYLITRMSNVISVFNTTGIVHSNPVFLFSQHLSYRNGEEPEVIGLRTFPEEEHRRTTHFLLVAWSRFKNELNIHAFDSLLPYEEAKSENAWIRAPVMIVIVAGVFLWQFNRTRLQKRAETEIQAGMHNYMQTSNREMDADFARFMRNSRAGPRGTPFPSGFGGNTSMGRSSFFTKTSSAPKAPSSSSSS